MAVDASAGHALSASLAGRLALLRGIRGPAVGEFTSRIRELVVIASGSRGGSSMFAEMLRRSGSLLHLQAEINPFLRLAGLGYPDCSDSDRLNAAHWDALSPEQRLLLDEELALDAGSPVEMIDDERYLLDVAWRFVVQWPELPLDPMFVVAAGREALARVRREHGWASHELRRTGPFQRELLRVLNAAGHRIDPRFYDLPGGLPRDVPDNPPQGAPGDLLIEEPPFVTARAWRQADDHDVDNKPLVVKTPSNAYRLGFLRAMFPRARLRLVHLTRNPAASANGLFDGWLHTGFHAHRTPSPLRIRGYADVRPDDRWWWKFDLPPGWANYTSAPLMSVCAFQWRSAHDAILESEREGGIDYLRVRYEDLITSRASRLRCMRRVSDWLGVPLGGAFDRAVRDGVDPVVATAPPVPNRWRRRGDAVMAALDPDTLRTAERLGYGAPSGWI